MIVGLGADGSGYRYVRSYLEQYGDLCSQIALRQIIACNGELSVVGPTGADEKVLREVTFGGGGFGISEEVAEYRESRIVEYLAQSSDRIAVFELLMGAESAEAQKLSFPFFVFTPSLYGTSDGHTWTYWTHGICGYQASFAFDVEALKSVLAESDWAKGIIFLLPLKDSDRARLEEGAVWDEGLLAGLFENVEGILIPAHNREALVAWQSPKKHNWV